MPKYPAALDIQYPVLPGFYPDPSVVRVGDTYYLANSTFEYGPGVPIHSSKNLLDWSFEGHALPTREHSDISPMLDSMGIFAPTIRHHNGKFYMITTLTDDKWQVLVTADNAAGPWSAPIRIDLFGIDPDLAWDDEGRCYMTYASLPLHGIGQVQINTETGEYVGEPKLLWQGNGGKFPEGPHLYRIGDWWYLLIAEGGTERGHAVAFARSRNIDGPFEADPMGVMLTNRGTDLPIQSTGHADLVQRPDGSWAMMFHGTRPRGDSPQWHVLGRETCAVNIEWVDGWPRIGEPIQPAAPSALVEVLTKNSDVPTQWISPGAWPAELFSKSSDGLTLKGYAGRRQTTANFDVRAKLRGDALHGIGVGIDSKHHFSILREGNSITAMWKIGENYFEVGRLALNGRAFEFRLQSLPMKGVGFFVGGPDKLIASVVFSDGTEQEVANIDGRYISTEVAGGMTGRVVGILATEPTLVESWTYQGS